MSVLSLDMIVRAQTVSVQAGRFINDGQVRQQIISFGLNEMIQATDDGYGNVRGFEQIGQQLFQKQLTKLSFKAHFNLQTRLYFTFCHHPLTVMPNH